MILVISSSLNPDSCSRQMARTIKQNLDQDSVATDWLDLQEVELPFCNASSCYSDEAVQKVGQQIADAECVLFACPVYNYDVGSAAKNLLELTGKNAWSDKIVGFMLAAGGQGSYMSVMPFANSLMLDFRCLIIPRFVYATSECLSDGAVTDETVLERIRELAETAAQMTKALRNEK